jgi:hypothetical protein
MVGLFIFSDLCETVAHCLRTTARATAMGLLMLATSGALTLSTVLYVKYGLGIVDEVSNHVNIVK